jgi:protein-S-isoprenylcysteine O-methyltransferase Ste14
MAWFGLFLAGILVPKTVDSGPAGDAGAAVAVDLALLLSFAIVHSLLARPAAKRALGAVIPPPLERSVYSLVAGLQIVLLLIAWRPLPETVWAPGAPVARALLWAGQAGGWLVVLASLAVVDAGHLFGWRQARAWALGAVADRPPLAARGPYRFVRHPLYSGTILAMWSAPAMSRGRLLIASLFTLYLLAGAWLEERDLARQHGAAWLDYRRAVPPFLPYRRDLTGRRLRP